MASVKLAGCAMAPVLQCHESPFARLFVITMYSMRMRSSHKSNDNNMRSVFRAFLIFFCGIALSTEAFAQQQSLLLFGGTDHKQFLGCLNCGRYDASSIWNAYGTYGSPYSSDSIWNRYGTWGSRYSSGSPWNKYASDAPVIVDKDGKFYGYFSANAYIDNRTRIDWLVWVLDNYDYVIDNLDKVRDKLN